MLHSTNTHTILIVDDSPMIRHSIRACIEHNTDWTVCGEAENGEAAITKVKQLKPQVVILDWQMPVMDGLQAARAIHGIDPSTTMLMVTLHETPRLSKEAIAAGVAEVLSKSERFVEHLIDSLRNLPV